jgi:hypothetical protein
MPQKRDLAAPQLSFPPWMGQRGHGTRGSFETFSAGNPEEIPHDPTVSNGFQGFLPCIPVDFHGFSCSFRFKKPSLQNLQRFVRGFSRVFLLLCVALLRSQTIAETAIRGAQKDRRDRGSVKEVAGEQHLGSNNVANKKSFKNRKSKTLSDSRFRKLGCLKSDTLMTSTH